MLKILVEKALSDEPLEDVYLASDDEPATLFDVLEWMKDRIGDVEDDHDLPEATRRANRRCSNKRIKDLGYRLKYPNFRIGYDQQLADIGLV
ncbi:hypothetical protein A3759_19195 [Thalassolituus sp. HI0120]|nr:hypothetical protein A3759_19195 [Thalassolituus sp. HI0120]